MVFNGRMLGTQSCPEWRRVSMAFERRWSAVASLTSPHPGLLEAGFSDATGQYRLASGLWLASEPIRNWTCHRGEEPRCDTTRNPKRFLSGAKVSGQDDLWSPAMFEHVNAQSVAQRDWLEYWGWKRARGLRTGSNSCWWVCMHSVGMATWSAAVRPPDLHWNPLPFPRCASLVQCLIVGGQGKGITPGMILYYRAGLPLRLSLLLLPVLCFPLLSVSPQLSCSLWCPHTLTSRLQQFTFSSFDKNWMDCVRIGEKETDWTKDVASAVTKQDILWYLGVKIILILMRAILGGKQSKKPSRRPLFWKIIIMNH